MNRILKGSVKNCSNVSRVLSSSNPLQTRFLNKVSLISSKNFSFAFLKYQQQHNRIYLDGENDDKSLTETTVSVTSSCRKNLDSMEANIGIYWGKDDELNAYKPFEPEDGTVNIVKVQLEAVALALRQAIYERKLTCVTIHTDSEFVTKVVQNYLPYWRTNNYIKRDGSPVKNRESIEELDRLLQQINARVEYVPFFTQKGNNVFNRLKEEGILAEDKEVYTSSELELFELSTSENKEIKGPKVYVAGKIGNSNAKGFKTAGYGIHWSNDGKGGEENDHCGRYSEIPVTLYRAQLTAILFALRQVISRGFKEVNIVTDCGMFLKHFKNKWLKKDGNPVANYPLYKSILRCTEKIEVKFTYIPQEIKNLEMEKALQCADDGMAYPVLSKEQMEELTKPFEVTSEDTHGIYKKA